MRSTTGGHAPEEPVGHAPTEQRRLKPWQSVNNSGFLGVPCREARFSVLASYSSPTSESWGWLRELGADVKAIGNRISTLAPVRCHV
eukprot:1194368-Prorocentrum_minimum.AAC.13